MGDRSKSQIQGLVAEIEELSKQDWAPGEFYSKFLPRVIAALAAPGGAIWMMNDRGQLVLQYQINIRATNLDRDQRKMPGHTKLLPNVIEKGEGMVMPPRSREDDDQGDNPTEYLLVLGPLSIVREPVGVVEIFQRTGAHPNVQQGYIRFLLSVCDLASDFLAGYQFRHPGERNALWTAGEDPSDWSKSPPKKPWWRFW